MDLGSPLIIGFWANLFPARVGEIIRPYILSKMQKIQFTGSLATILVERVFDLIIFLILLSWLLVFNTDVFNSKWQWSGLTLKDLAFQFGIFSLAVLVLLLALITLLVYYIKPLKFVFNWILKPFQKKSVRPLKS